MEEPSTVPARTSFRARPATTITMLVCIVAFGVAFGWTLARAEDPLDAAISSLWKLPDAEVLVGLGGLQAVRVWLDGEWWRVAGAGLLHGSWLHLVVNMSGLWSVGQWTEKVLGARRSTGVLVMSSLVGCLASLAWAEAPLVVGASAGIFGLAGALWVALASGHPSIRAQLPDDLSARWLGGLLVFWLAVGFALPLFGVELIAQAGHVGGLVAGLVLGWALTRGSRRLELVGWATSISMVVGVAFAAREPSWRAHYHEFIGSRWLEQGELDAARASFETALAMSPDDPGMNNSVAWALVEAGVELERAEVLVRRALESEPEEASYLDTLGWVLCKQGRTAEGIEVLGQALEFEEGDDEIEGHLEQCGSVAMFHVEPSDG